MSTLTYADDMGVIEDSIEEMVDSIKLLEETATMIGLTINPKKCYSLHISNDHQSIIPSEFKINNTEINILHDLNATKYLGKPFGFHVIPDSDKLGDFIDTGITILNSCMAPWQKLDALKTFVFPSFMFSMRMEMFDKTQWRELDLKLRPLIKDVLGLSVDACTDYIYGDSSQGLFGIPDMQQMILI